MLNNEFIHDTIALSNLHCSQCPFTLFKSRYMEPNKSEEDSCPTKFTTLHLGGCFLQTVFFHRGGPWHPMSEKWHNSLSLEQPHKEKVNKIQRLMGISLLAHLSAAWPQVGRCYGGTFALFKLW